MLARVAAVARHPVALAITAFAIGAWALLRVTRFRASSPFAVWGDASIVFDKALEILRSSHYPATLARGNFNDVFPYPPPAALMFGAVANLGAAAFMTLWVAMVVASLFAVFRFSVVNEPSDTRHDFVALMPAVIVLCSNAIDYDLLNANNNLIVLALVMASFALMRRTPVAAGLLLALPIAIKLYSAALLLWAIVYRPRAAAACVIALAALWLVLPVAVFGVQGAVNLYRGWAEQLAIVNDPWVYALPAGRGPPLISLRRAAAWLTGSPPYAAPSAFVLAAMQATWLVVLIAYGWVAVRVRNVSAISRPALADWAVLLLAPLPFSPWLEPYHAVGMIPAFVLCILIVFDDALPVHSRRIAGSVCVATLILKLLGTSFEIRGLFYLVQFILLTLGLAAMRADLARVDANPAAGKLQAAEGGSASTE